MADPIAIFDRRLVRRRRDRAAATQDRIAPILAEAADRLLDRLDDTTRRFGRALEIGGRGLIAPRLAKAGDGAIINIGSVVGLAPEFGMSVYGATKAFVLFLSQGLSLELSPQGVYVQAVLPAATRTEIWDRAGIDINTLTDIMEVGDMVDAALVGFDRREVVTIPPLHEGERWDALQTARQGLLGQIRQSAVAQRYLTQA